MLFFNCANHMYMQWQSTLAFYFGNLPPHPARLHDLTIQRLDDSRLNQFPTILVGDGQPPAPPWPSRLGHLAPPSNYQITRLPNYQIPSSLSSQYCQPRPPLWQHCHGNIPPFFLSIFPNFPILLIRSYPRAPTSVTPWHSPPLLTRTPDPGSRFPSPRPLQLPPPPLLH